MSSLLEIKEWHFFLYIYYYFYLHVQDKPQKNKIEKEN